MEKFKQWWKAVPAIVRKPLILMVGTLVVLVGIVLIPLPGPGWLVIFAGFALLATEFAFAEKTRDWLIHLVMHTIKGWFVSLKDRVTKNKA